MRSIFLFLSLIISFSAAVATARAETGSIEVSVTYRERIALPPRAELDVRLVDLSSTGIATRSISSQRYAMFTVPLNVALSYDPAVLTSASDYGVVASIFTQDGQEMFRSTAPVEVRIEQAAGPVELTLTMLPDNDVKMVPSTITGVMWTVTETLGAPWATDDPATMTIDADGGVSLFGGCNRFRGQVQHSVGGLAFPENLAGTMMACPDEVELLERRFIAALRLVTGYVRYGAGLIMTDAQGNAILHFVETPE